MDRDNTWIHVFPRDELSYMYVRIEARWTLSDLLLEVRQRHDVVVSQVHVRPVEG